MLRDIYNGPSYSIGLFIPETRRFIVEKMKALINDRFPGINALAARGNSGIPIASILAHELELPLIAVRRSSDESSHDSSVINGYSGPGTYVIIDDLISSGKTVDAIMNEVEETNPHLKPAGIVLYSEGYGEFYEAETGKDGKIRIPVADVATEVNAFMNRLNRDSAHLQTTAFLMNATNVWRDGNHLHVKLEDGREFLGTLNIIWENSRPTSLEEWIDLLLDTPHTGPFVLCTYCSNLRSDLLVLPSLTKDELQKLYVRHRTLSYVNYWIKRRLGDRNGSPEKLNLENKTGLSLRDDLVLAMPPLSYVNYWIKRRLGDRNGSPEKLNLENKTGLSLRDDLVLAMPPPPEK